MKKVINSEKIPIKLWLNDIEEGALEQAKNLANLPFSFKHIALMPDCHQGYGMPIGGVLATIDTVIPNAVGVDIGCGICATRLPLKIDEINIDIIKKIMGKIRKEIPFGPKHHKTTQYEWLSKQEKNELQGWSIIDKEYDRSLYQLGTLGGGNHFIEIQKGSDGYIWIMIHSGSRNIGYKVAQHYNKIAKDKNKKWFTSIPDKWDLSFLPLNSYEGKSYMIEMNHCINFSFLNRQHMLNNILKCFKEQLIEENMWDENINIYNKNMINIGHNFASIEHHFKKNVVIHRKGATQARKHQYGIIPGSQGSSSYIVYGLGNKESFESCSHGAGRKMSRTKAQNELDLQNEKRILDEQGIIHSIRNKKDLDESSSAYKDISIVMKNQEDLVKTFIELKPIGVLKG